MSSTRTIPEKVCLDAKKMEKIRLKCLGWDQRGICARKDERWREIDPEKVVKETAERLYIILLFSSQFKI